MVRIVVIVKDLLIKAAPLCIKAAPELESPSITLYLTPGIAPSKIFSSNHY